MTASALTMHEKFLRTLPFGHVIVAGLQRATLLRSFPLELGSGAMASTRP